jgi:hypothetical protein
MTGGLVVGGCLAGLPPATMEVAQFDSKLPRFFSVFSPTFAVLPRAFKARVCPCWASRWMSCDPMQVGLFWIALVIGITHLFV